MKTTQLRQSQRGVAAIMVSTVLVLVVGLIIVGFSQAARRNERESLDRQLSTQAFYAAESGVNAAKAVIEAKSLAGQPITDKTDCASSADYPDVVLDPSVKVTCLLITSGVFSLTYSGVTESSSTIVPVIATNGATINQVTLTWNSRDGTTVANCPTGGLATNQTRQAWSSGCNFPMLRADLTRLPTGSTSQFATTGFFKPQNSTAASNLAYPNSGKALGRCAVGGNSCVSSFTNLAALGGSVLYLRVNTIYKDADLSVSARDSAGNQLRLGGQVQIDSTGQAQDVLRRIQVRVPVEDPARQIPNFAIQSADSICKRFLVGPGFFQDSGISCPAN